MRTSWARRRRYSSAGTSPRSCAAASRASSTA
nr:MAG TPA: hypothetical protein [Caudoviricetes sp.]